jgi:hypothetical protein
MDNLHGGMDRIPIHGCNTVENSILGSKSIMLEVTYNTSNDNGTTFHKVNTLRNWVSFVYYLDLYNCNELKTKSVAYSSQGSQLDFCN